MLRNIYTSTAIFAFHSCLILYINSSFLGKFFDNAALGVIYIVGAIINIILLVSLPRIIGNFGVHRVLLLFILLEGIATLGMVFANSPFFAASSFTLHQAMIIMILFLFDEYLEYASKKEGFTGRIRSAYLTISSTVLVVSPTLAGAIAGGPHGFDAVYMLSSFFLIPLFFIVWRNLRFKESSQSYDGIRKAIVHCLKDKNSLTIVLCRFTLESFYAWMVIYMAIYLVQTVGFEWKEVGSIFTIMLLPFVLFEIPLGNLSDRSWGEKEIIIIGFSIIALSTFFIPFIAGASFFLWASILFLTRVGASFAEIGTESFFFKHVKGKDAGMISLYRATKPFSYIASPAIATITFSLLSYQNSFFVLAVFALCGSFAALKLKDTR